MDDRPHARLRVVLGVDTPQHHQGPSLAQQAQGGVVVGTVGRSEEALPVQPGATGDSALCSLSWVSCSSAPSSPMYTWSSVCQGVGAAEDPQDAGGVGARAVIEGQCDLALERLSLPEDGGVGKDLVDPRFLASMLPPARRGFHLRRRRPRRFGGSAGALGVMGAAPAHREPDRHRQRQGRQHECTAAPEEAAACRRAPTVRPWCAAAFSQDGTTAGGAVAGPPWQ